MVSEIAIVHVSVIETVMAIILAAVVIKIHNTSTFNRDGKKNNHYHGTTLSSTNMNLVIVLV